MGAVSVLAVGPFAEEKRSLAGIFSHSNWSVRFVENAEEARAVLRESPLGVVISESRFDDGRSWKDVLAEIERLTNPPALIVTDRLADDHLWMEVLDSGGYDLLMIPFDPTEVFRVVGLAWLSWKRRVGAPKPPLAATSHQSLSMTARASHN